MLHLHVLYTTVENRRDEFYDLINELDISITYQEILYHNRSSPYLSSTQKKEGSFEPSYLLPAPA